MKGNDVKSAVDWLKNEILYTDIQKLSDEEIDKILKLIDKAFQDVIE